jgi:hypothetical protein
VRGGNQVGEGHPSALLTGQPDQLVGPALGRQIGVERDLQVHVVIDRIALGDDREG